MQTEKPGYWLTLGACMRRWNGLSPAEMCDVYLKYLVLAVRFARLGVRMSDARLDDCIWIGQHWEVRASNGYVPSAQDARTHTGTCLGQNLEGALHGLTDRLADMLGDKRPQLAQAMRLDWPKPPQPLSLLPDADLLWGVRQEWAPAIIRFFDYFETPSVHGRARILAALEREILLTAQPHAMEAVGMRRRRDEVREERPVRARWSLPRPPPVYSMR